MSRLLLPLCSLLLSGSLASAETLAWWRFELNGSSERGKQLSLLLPSTAVFPDKVPGHTIISDGKPCPDGSSYFNGEDQKGGSVPANATINNTFANGSFTVECFVYLDPGAVKNQYLRIIGSFRDSKKAGWAFGISSGALTFSAIQGLKTASVRLIASQPLSEGAWYHVAVVGYRDPEKLNLRLFVNGEEQKVRKEMCCFPGEDGVAIVPSDGDLIIGGVNAFQGAIDELRISNVSLEPDEFLKVAPPAAGVSKTAMPDIKK